MPTPNLGSSGLLGDIQDGITVTWSNVLWAVGGFGVLSSALAWVYYKAKKQVVTMNENDRVALQDARDKLVESAATARDVLIKSLQENNEMLVQRKMILLEEVRDRDATILTLKNDLKECRSRITQLEHQMVQNTINNNNNMGTPRP